MLKSTVLRIVWVERTQTHLELCEKLKRHIKMISKAAFFFSAAWQR